MLAVRMVTIGIVAAVTVIAGPVTASATPSASPAQTASGSVTSGLADWPWE